MHPLGLRQNVIAGTKWAVSLHLARSGSQSQRGIWFILPAREACQIIIKYFEEGMSQKDSKDDSQGPASTQNFNFFYIHFERGHSQHENIPIKIPSNLPAELLRSLQPNNFDRMIHFTIDSLNISALFLRTDEHTFGIRCLTSLFRISTRSCRGIPFNRDRVKPITMGAVSLAPVLGLVLRIWTEDSS